MKNHLNIEQKDLNQGQQIYVFSAEWCKDCIALNSYIDNIIKQNEQWEFIYVDVDKNPSIAQEHSIMGIPSFVAKIDGHIVSDLISKDYKSESLINSWIKTIGKI